MKRPLVLLAASTLAACSTLTGAIDRNLPAVPTGQGIVVFSTGAARTDMGASALAVVDRSGASISTFTDMYLNNPMRSSDFEDEHGKVRMLVLSPGEYCFRPVLSNNPLIEYSGRPPDVAFHVRSGTIVYLGSVFLGPDLRLQIRDRSVRDVARFRAKNPSLEAQPVAHEPARVIRDCRAGQ